QLFRGGSTSLGTTTADGTGAWTLTVGSALADGTYSITAKATDLAGNTSVASGALSVTIDTSAPGLPSFTGITTDTGSSSSDRITSDTTLVLNGTAEANSTVTVTRVGPGVIGSATANGSGIWSFDYTAMNLADGTYTFTATATDAAGNTSSASANFVVTIDTLVPTPPTGLDLAAADDSGVSNSDNITKNTSALTISGTGEANSTVELFDGATSKGTTIASVTGSWTKDISLTAGVHSITATATDAAGNVSAASGALSITIDTTAPAAPSTPDLNAASDSGSSSTDNLTSVKTPTFTGTAEANSTVQLFRGGSTSLGTTTADGTGAWALTVGSALADGTYSITAKATDLAGNTSVASGALSVTIDTSAPGLPSFTGITTDTGSSSSDRITSDTTLVLNGTAEANSTVTVTRVGPGVIGSATANGSGIWTFDYTATSLAEGSYTFTATAT